MQGVPASHDCVCLVFFRGMPGLGGFAHVLALGFEGFEVSFLGLNFNGGRAGAFAGRENLTAGHLLLHSGGFTVEIFRVAVGLLFRG